MTHKLIILTKTLERRVNYFFHFTEAIEPYRLKQFACSDTAKKPYKWAMNPGSLAPKLLTFMASCYPVIFIEGRGTGT